ncbi:MAG: cation:proton antiporter [Candidatus Nanoarchaeia archaeon]
MNLFLFLASMFLLIFVIGKLLEKIRVPWIFSALLIGLGLAVYNPFSEITASPAFNFLAELGMYFLLFIIGFELDIKEILKQKDFVFKTTFAVILAETTGGSIVVHYVFGVSWPISILVASSFATVGEAVLLPILDEFKLVKTRLGQTILGIGVLDDIVELLTLIIASVFISRSVGQAHSNIWFTFIVLGALFVLMYLLIKLQENMKRFYFKDVPSLFLFILFFFFLFTGLGAIVNAAAIGAILAGIALRNMLPHKKRELIDAEVRTMAYGFFAPLFFLWVGIDTDVDYLIKYPLLILLFMAVTKSTKIITSYFMGRKILGPKKSIILGVSLCVKFSTSIILIKMLFESNLISQHLYSVFIGTKIAFKFVVPFLLAYLITKWKISTTSKT